MKNLKKNWEIPLWTRGCVGPSSPPRPWQGCMVARLVEWIPAACKRHATPPPLIRVDTTYTLLLHSDPGKRKSQPSWIPRSAILLSRAELGGTASVSSQTGLSMCDLPVRWETGAVLGPAVMGRRRQLACWPVAPASSGPLAGTMA